MKEEEEEEEEGSSLLQKGPERLEERHVCLRAIKVNAGMLLQICTRRRRIPGSSVSDNRRLTVFLSHHTSEHKRLNRTVHHHHPQQQPHTWQIYDTLFAATKTTRHHAVLK
ncbi:Hypothetical predicted protein [Xyrichtys novacula]|uniref:Uncharacterized protein n=1 Tax=Xyrichtys novacula TaxID=13765 RepID=A0AAV1HE85_XYRNO|nr:Hypothetical predicted protein [Xyrichtys novacula]